MVTTKFACIDLNEWRLSGDIEQEWRALLHSSQTYESVIQRLSCEAKVIEVHRNKSKCFPGYFRAHVRVQVSAESCTLFHSGRSGYRAQYYRSITNGEQANTFAVLSLAHSILPQLGETRLMVKGWIEKSLCGLASKLWLHQGLWLRNKRNSDRMLCVTRWMRELSATDKHRSKLALWGSLVPRYEDKIDIKGTFLTLDEVPLASNAKVGRSKDLNELGFT